MSHILNSPRGSKRRPSLRPEDPTGARQSLVQALSLLALLMVSACGANTDVDNGSNTSWLMNCTKTSQCGTGVCANGLCTVECDGDAVCAALDAAAVCRPVEAVAAAPSSCDGAASRSLCVPACDEGSCSAMGDGYECREGQCVPTECAASYDPCFEKSCGESCRQCPPDDGDCVETEEVKRCDAQGECTGGPAQCEACADVAAESCDESGCATIAGVLVADADAAPTPLGCLDRETACTEAETFGVGPDGRCFWFSSGCQPAGFEAVDECPAVVDYEPCAGKSCGDSCQLCAPDDAECDSTDDRTYCDASGACRQSTPSCDDCASVAPEGCEAAGCLTLSGTQAAQADAAPEALGCLARDTECTAAETFGVGPDGRCFWFNSGCQPAGFEPVDECPGTVDYEPCAGKSCGDSCQLCAPDDADCTETAEVKTCGIDGLCSSAEPACLDCGAVSAGTCEENGCDTVFGQLRNSEVDELQALACVQPGGDCVFAVYCTVDDAGRCFELASCAGTLDLISCDDPLCCEGDECTPYVEADPCADKECGDPCFLCDGATAPCQETAVEKACDAAGNCTAGAVSCEGTGCSSVSPDSCEASGCVLITGTPAQEATSEPVGCMAADQGCADVITCALAPDTSCFRFPDSCIPADFTATDCASAACCEGDDCGVVIEDPSFSRIEYSAGECIGECRRILSKAADSQALTYEACTWGGTCVRTNTGVLTEAGAALLDDALATLSGQRVAEVYGCPDCADGGATRVDLVSALGESSHTYESGAPPEVFVQLDAALAPLTAALNQCVASEWVTLGSCTEAQPRDCTAMDAASGDAACEVPLGFAWVGFACEQVVCDCTGTQCDALFATEEECLTAYALCF